MFIVREPQAFLLLNPSGASAANWRADGLGERGPQVAGDEFDAPRSLAAKWNRRANGRYRPSPARDVQQTPAGRCSPSWSEIDEPSPSTARPWSS